MNGTSYQEKYNPPGKISANIVDLDEKRNNAVFIKYFNEDIERSTTY